MDAVVARKMYRTLEPYHSFVYFAPQSRQLDYFATRAAGMGPVPAEVVVATFFNFAPRLVEQSVPRVWQEQAPAAWHEARLDAVDHTLQEVVVDQAAAVEAAQLARRAAEACEAVGRPLYAGHASLPWPSDDQPHLVLWHAVTLLREHRGDGHIAALLVEGLDGCQALVMHAAAGDVPRSFLQGSRGWSDVEWEKAEGWLRERGWIDEAGGLTDAGRAARDRYEEATDRLALRPWETLGPDDCDRLRTMVRPFSRAIVEAGLLSFVR
ncbi:MAG TPA: hypothetical protein VM938_06255 [Acidimicrobiales bacterium]|nr:hypothetical protein [Acidimicrobiales bacterium]